MLWVPKKGILRVQHNTGSVGSLTPGTSCTTGGATSTKGTAVQIFASTSFDSYWMTIMAANYGGTAATAADGAMDILIGAATEEVIIANLLMGFCGGVGLVGKGPKRWDFPLYVPSGSRIAVQAAGRRISTAFQVWMFLYGGDGSPPFRVGGKVTTYGMGTVPNGTAITPGASGAEGAWTQITASTSQDHFALVPSFQVGNDPSINLRGYAVDLGTGAATEEMVAESYWFGTESGVESMGGPINTMPTFIDIPSGTRLVMRASNSGTNDGAYDAVIHAVS